jgi:VWFA-related protein
MTRGWLVATAALLVASPGAARQHVGQPGGVRLHVDVLQAGAPVPGLTRDDFELLVDERPQVIDHFSAGPLPLSAILLVDASTSTMTSLDRRGLKTEIAQFFVGGLQPGDRAAFGRIAQQVTVGTTLTDDKAALLAAIDPILNPPRGDSAGPSPIVDAMEAAITVLGKEKGRRVLVVLSDGRSTGNVRSASEVAHHAIAARVAVVLIGGDFPIAAADNSSSSAPPSGMWIESAGPERPVDRGRVSLSRTVELFGNIIGGSGGALLRLFEPPAQPRRTTADTRYPFGRVLSTLRSGYVLGFTPAVTDDAFHAIRVHVKRSDVIVRAPGSHVASLSR